MINTQSNTTDKKGSITPRFELGKCVMTIGAEEALIEASQEPKEFLDRHQSGDWGVVCSDDAQANELSIKEGLRIMSVYQTQKGTRLYVITEYNRSYTTILLPDEY